MDEKDIERAIKNLKEKLTIYESNKLSEILSIILMIIAFLGGGLILGSIFESVPVFTTISLIASAVPLSTKFKELENINMDIKYTRKQIVKYNSDIKNLEALRKDLAHPQKKKASEEKPKEKYEYKGKNSSSNVKDVPIEFFSENDFLNDEKDNGHKKR